jgi:hypothetical protein
LAQPDPNGCARETIADRRTGARSLFRDHRIDDLPLERHEFRHSVTLEQKFECIVIAAPQRSFPSELIAKRMRRINVRTRDPSLGQWPGCRMGAAMREQFWQNVGVGPYRTLSARRRDRLKDLGPADTADEDAMRVGREDDAHRVTDAIGPSGLVKRVRQSTASVVPRDNHPLSYSRALGLVAQSSRVATSKVVSC